MLDTPTQFGIGVVIGSFVIFYGIVVVRRNLDTVVALMDKVIENFSKRRYRNESN